MFLEKVCKIDEVPIAGEMVVDGVEMEHDERDGFGTSHGAILLCCHGISGATTVENASGQVPRCLGIKDPR
jgi:hypothetical protein